MIGINGVVLEDEKSGVERDTEVSKGQTYNPAV